MVLNTGGPLVQLRGGGVGSCGCLVGGGMDSTVHGGFVIVLFPEHECCAVSRDVGHWGMVFIHERTVE